jgi:arylsulfatase A-like enzyme
VSIKFFPHYLKEAGYYTSNNAKKDYNTIDQPEVWDESSNTATYKNRKPGQPFFSIFNLTVSHESSLHAASDELHHDPEKVAIPPYHPKTPEMKHDWAQYYDKMEQMDAQAGAIIKELEEAGLADNTIVFYYSDHGGALGRSKRFLYESGLHIPLIIRFPPKFKHLAPGNPGSKTDRIVTFADFAPTILNLANIPAPDYMQGQAFLGKNLKDPSEYAFAFRGRMDERIDVSVQIAAAEALYNLGQKDKALKTLKSALQHDNKMARVQALNVLEQMNEDARPAFDLIKSLTKDDLQDQDYDSRAASRIVEVLEGNQ